MKYSRSLNFSLIIIGGGIAIFADVDDEQNMYLLVTGIFILMMGLYRLSKGLSSREDDDDQHQKNVRF